MLKEQCWLKKSNSFNIIGETYMNQESQKYKDEGILIKGFEDKSIPSQVREMVERRFDQPDDFYLNLSRDKFHDLAYEAQVELNEMNIQQRFYQSEKTLFDSLFPNEELLHESVVFFRAVRPMKNGITMEAPDFHRETFYSDHDHTPYCINTWIPIKNVNEQNTLKYYPMSHTIPDADLSIEVDSSAPGKVEKFSSGHKLGFLWKPKKLKEDIDIGRSKNMEFFEDSYSIFSSMLIHGGAVNHSDKIRFAIGFGLIPSKRMTHNKKFFASDGKPHYIPFN